MENAIHNATAVVVQNATEVVAHEAGRRIEKRYAQIMAFLVQAFLWMIVGVSQPGFKGSAVKPNPYNTYVRVYAGGIPFEGDKLDLRGHAPQVSLWTEDGKKMGHYVNKNRKHPPIIAQGAFLDITVPHHRDFQNARPHYMNLIAGGSDALCISGFEVTYPDGNTVTVTGDALLRCLAAGNIKSMKGKPLEGLNLESKTQMGFDNHPPACFFLDGDASFEHLWMRAISFKLPDFNPTDERASAWTKDPDQLCGPSPRMFYFEDDVNVNTPVPIWNPPFEYNRDSTDSDANRVRNWRNNKAEQEHYAIHGRDLSMSPNATAPFEYDHAGDAHPEQLDESTPFQPRQLIKNHHPNFSAMMACHNGTNIGDDYISTHEGVFCDMKLRNMWHVCDGPFTAGCFDMNRNILRGFEVDLPLDYHNNSTDHTQLNTTVIRQRDIRRRAFPLVGTDNRFNVTATTEHDGPVYGMKYAKVKMVH